MVIFMKKTLVKIMLIAAAMVLVLVFAAACDPGTTPQTSPDATYDSGISDPTPGAKKAFLYIEIDGAVIESGVTVKAFLEKLSEKGVEPVATDEAESCMFDGKDVTYHFSFGDVFTFPQESGRPVEDNVVDEIYVTSENVTAMDGVKVGDTVAKVKEVFGESFFTDGSRLIYNKSGSVAGKDTEPCIYFYIEEGVVTGIGLLANLYHVEA